MWGMSAEGPRGLPNSIGKQEQEARQGSSPVTKIDLDHLSQWRSQKRAVERDVTEHVMIKRSPHPLGLSLRAPHLPSRLHQWDFEDMRVDPRGGLLTEWRRGGGWDGNNLSWHFPMSSFPASCAHPCLIFADSVLISTSLHRQAHLHRLLTKPHNSSSSSSTTTTTSRKAWC